jgi:hypothetical protein
MEPFMVWELLIIEDVLKDTGTAKQGSCRSSIRIIPYFIYGYSWRLGYEV